MNDMKKIILVTGAGGQLGNAIRVQASERSGDVFYFTDVDSMDVCDKSQLSDFVRHNGVQYLINCAAYTAVDKAEDDVEQCMRINRDAVRNMGEVAAGQNIRLMHISTDYVFDGNARQPYREDDPVNPQSVYGLSKLAGEQALQSICPQSVIIRTAWLYSEFGNNFFKTMLRLGNERETVRVVDDQVGTPTYAADLAEALFAIVDSPVFRSGIYHYSNQGVCSWYDFAAQIMQRAAPNCRVIPVKTHEYPTRAVRPAYSVLSKEKIKQTYGVQTPDWSESLAKALRKVALYNK